MKPQTKLEIEIVELSKQLPVVADEKILWAYDKCLDNFAVRSRNTLFCLECGYSWNDTASLISAIDGCVCPDCNNQLNMYQYSAVNYKEAAYFAVLDTKNDFQIVRMFIVSKYMKKREKAFLSSQEVMQHWVDNNGTITTLSKAVQGFNNGCFDLWVSHTDLEIRTKSEGAKLRAGLNPLKIHPNRKVLPVFKRNGFNGYFFDFTPHKWFSVLLTNNKAETLVKAKQYSVLRSFDEKKINKYWGALKICIRNNYTITDASIYFDYLDLLAFFNKDVNSPKYCCPLNLSKAHDRLMNKKNTIIKNEKLQKMRQNIELEQVAFERNKKPFFGLVFCEGQIKIKVIDTVEGFFEEAEVHNHCVFSNEYFKKQNSLVLSAVVNNVPAETIEVSLESFSINQARGKGNKATQYHQKIIQLVNKNMFQIKNALLTA